ncbi:hypothetical protein [Undibacterium oligocarboniphilum]|nr:hypothetical protein [Undibacterium oligocarboniphilum]
MMSAAVRINPERQKDYTADCLHQTLSSPLPQSGMPCFSEVTAG